MRSVGGRLLTLEGLLATQGAAVRDHPAFPKLVALLHGSAALTRLRFEPAAYRLLNSGRLEARYLPNFYATYRIPPSPFFPLLLTVKRECTEKREAASEARGRRILTIMETYPDDVLGLVKYLAKAERETNADFPVWKKRLFPRTLKRAREMQAFDLKQWMPFLSEYIGALRARYRRLTLPPTETLLACMLLRCLPDLRTGTLSDVATIERSYQTLAAAYAVGSAEERRRLPLLAAARAVLTAAAAGKPARGDRGQNEPRSGAGSGRRGGPRPRSPSQRKPS